MRGARGLLAVVFDAHRIGEAAELDLDDGKVVVHDEQGGARGAEAAAEGAGRVCRQVLEVGGGK